MANMRSMKWALITLAALAGFAVIMLVANVFLHDQTVAESLKNFPDDLWRIFNFVLSLAWQYKFAAAVVAAVIVTIIVIRQVPDIGHR